MIKYRTTDTPTGVVITFITLAAVKAYPIMSETNNSNDNNKRASLPVWLGTRKKRKERERAESRRSKIKALDEQLQSHRRIYEDQVENGVMFYQYNVNLWSLYDEFFMPYRPESLVGVYDIIFMSAYREGEYMNRTIKDTTLTITHDGEFTYGKVKGGESQSLDAYFEFKGSWCRDCVAFDIDESSLVTDWEWGSVDDDYTPGGDIFVLASRVPCNWILSEDYDDRYKGPVPGCYTIEEANKFIAQQQGLKDHSKSWISNYLELPDPAVSLIHEYAKAWTPPTPFFFFEKGDLCVKVDWGEPIRGNCEESQYIARKRPTADQK